MTLNADVRAGVDGFTLDCRFRAPADSTLALLGPNGAGKTTLLRVLAGLLRMQAGRVSLGDDVLEDTQGSAWQRPERRRIGVVFQDHALFPHMSALDNVAFGLRARGVDRGEARTRAQSWLERTGAAAVAARRPAALSGGERQRVALARALVIEPRLLLLDEPLAAVDAASRIELRRSLREHLDAFPGPRVLVTHDPVEAAALAAEVLVLEGGRVTQSGTFADVTARPRSEWVARVAGLNLLRGRAEHGTLVTAAGARLAIASPVEGPVLATVHPRAISLHRERPTGSPRNVLACSVAGVDPEGDRWRIRLTGEVPLVAEVTPAAATDLQLAAGGPVFAGVKATEIDVYAA